VLKDGRSGREWAIILAGYLGENPKGLLYAVGSSRAELDCAQSTLVPVIERWHTEIKSFSNPNEFLSTLKTTLPPDSFVVVDGHILEKVIDMLGVELNPRIIFGPYRDWFMFWFPKTALAAQGVVPLEIEDRKTREQLRDPWPPY